MEGDGKLFLKNYFAGQIHDSDDNPAVLPTFKKKENKEYEQIFEKFIKEQKKTFVSWREADKKFLDSYTKECCEKKQRYYGRPRYSNRRSSERRR